MKLGDINILPGAVVDIEDPKFIGRVKAAAPGLFDESVMSKDSFPWIYPVNIPGYQRFSTLREGSKIWVLVVGDDCREFWYLPMFELTGDTRDIISSEEDDYKDAEVLLSRNNGSMGVYIYYIPSKGIMIQNSDNTLINLNKENEIIIKSSDGEILIKDSKVYIGNNKSDFSDSEPAVLGNKLQKIINAIVNYISALQSAMGQSYNPPCMVPLTESQALELQNLSTSINYLSDNVNLN